MTEPSPSVDPTSNGPNPTRPGQDGDPTAVRPGWTGRVLFLLQLVASLAIVGGALVYLLFFHAPAGERVEATDTTARSLVRAVDVLGPSQLRIDMSSSLGRQLTVGRVSRDEITAPLLRVSGTVAASLRPAGPDGDDEWQFNEPEALEAFTDWQIARVDAQFFEEQIERMKQLNETRMRSQKQILDRLRRLVDAGTDTLADLQIAEAEYLQTEIEGRQDIHEAESDFRRARQEVAVAARQLQLMGLDVDMVLEATADVDVVVAEVPEDYIARVRIGQECRARFFGFPREIFPGVVRRVSPTLSIERRALRVLFFVDDPDDKLRPGMFADIGLGTEARQATLVPAEAVIHVGKDDFVFTREPDDTDTWRLVEVEIGDTRAGVIEVLEGLQPEAEIITAGAILLKPVAASMVRDATRGDR